MFAIAGGILIALAFLAAGYVSLAMMKVNLLGGAFALAVVAGLALWIL